MGLHLVDDPFGMHLQLINHTTIGEVDQIVPPLLVATQQPSSSQSILAHRSDVGVTHLREKTKKGACQQQADKGERQEKCQKRTPKSNVTKRINHGTIIEKPRNAPVEISYFMSVRPTAVTINPEDWWNKIAVGGLNAFCVFTGTIRGRA